MDLRLHPLSDLVALIRGRSLAARELVATSLARIEELEPRLNAWAALDGDRALAEAAAIDERLAAGEELGPLAGIPIGVKDLEAAAGFTTAYGSALHVSDAPAEADSPLVARLRAAGCIVVGKTTTPEFGFQGDTTSPAFGPTRNPWGTDRSPGGSSGGSAVAIASGMVPLATGSDGGGSIRLPSSLCGLSGIKTSQGRVPNGGATPPGSGLFTVKGPMARRIADVVYALDVCVGPDPTDVFSLPPPHSPWGSVMADRGVPSRVIWAPAPGFEVDAEIAGVCAAAVEALAAVGTEVIEVDRVFTDEPLADWFTMWTVYCERRQGSLRDGPEWERIDPGLRSQMDHAHANVDTVAFAKAIDSAHTHNLDLVKLFDRAPILLCPTVAGQTAVVGHQGTVNGVETPFWAPFTGPYNLTRNPAGTVPVGFTADGMPVGLQVIGPQHADVAVLRTIAVLEDVVGVDALAPLA
jgi:Asp-tRNA(Asn)/Glu-tRNA(Gln) amidotransferase A subunit family amidase